MLIQLITELFLFATALAVIEYMIHRHTMHRTPRYLQFLHWSKVWHADQHHAQQQNNKHEHLDILLAPYVIVFCIGTTSACLLYGPSQYCATTVIALATTLTTHRVLWNKMHRCMHDTETNWTTRLFFYEGFRKHHLDHHRHPKYNFGVVFPITDKVFGTKWRSIEEEPNGH